jgi:hypothetical protein
MVDEQTSLGNYKRLRGPKRNTTSGFHLDHFKCLIVKIYIKEGNILNPDLETIHPVPRRVLQPISWNLIINERNAITRWQGSTNIGSFLPKIRLNILSCIVSQDGKPG